MNKLEVLENKKLVLKNVLQKELKNIKMEQVDKEIAEFMKQIKLLNAQVFGPLVICTSGSNISEDGMITMNYDLFAQAHDYLKYKHEFATHERFVCEHCIYLHYEGTPEDISFAHSKLDLYFYENELISTGKIYTVCISKSNNYMVTDLFRPVLQL